MFPLVSAFPSAWYTILVICQLTTVFEIEWHFDNIAVDAGGEDKEENVSFPLGIQLDLIYVEQVADGCISYCAPAAN